MDVDGVKSTGSVGHCATTSDEEVSASTPFPDDKGSLFGKFDPCVASAGVSGSSSNKFRNLALAICLSIDKGSGSGVL